MLPLLASYVYQRTGWCVLHPTIDVLEFAEFGEDEYFDAGLEVARRDKQMRPLHDILHGETAALLNRQHLAVCGGAVVGHENGHYLGDGGLRRSAHALIHFVPGDRAALGLILFVC